MKSRFAFAVVVAVAILLARPVSARDGVHEINQACAVATGCVAGDAPGFPVTLGSGSFRLTSDLSVTDPDTHAIQLIEDGAQLDLNDFELNGPVSCTGLGAAVSCTPPGTGAGIEGNGADRVVVRNGRIHGFGQEGVRLGARSQVRNVASDANGGEGIWVLQDSMVSDSSAHRNRGYGIVALQGSILLHNTASANLLSGVASGIACIVVGNVAFGNGGTGIGSGDLNVVRSNSAAGNVSLGLAAGAHSVMADNAVVSNESIGISAPGSTLLQGNNVQGNGGLGIAGFAGSGPACRENTITGNVGGSVDTIVDLGANSCNGTGACP